ncbi:GNAT family N-acetyltransferase [Paenibacillus sp. HN-1]|uniref:GNAT family N-acetyltransferase n=1 Tax=Paenibacillus TaxID=44249 RepID=UPI001CA86E9D|nr:MULTISPECIES: GNAT family N-acetyltransferase [Paenibacillus]MBY9078677.1 GNAT family N-acetyltransferase [Paenibacillus sp. CGMCC 1.18879]MBY9084213.1 GNAT family N-acetyltransferase [Paenibacillus sinensis]
MENVIRQGRMDDLEQIMALIAECVRVMREGGSDQWNESYPNREVIAEDIEQGTIYVLEDDGAPAGIIVLDENEAEEYKSIDWVHKEGRYLVMHRLAVHPRIQGKGIARRLLAFAEDQAVREGYSSIRMDTYAKNDRALGLYLRLGYETRGEVRFPGRVANFPVMEKLLKPVED